MNHLEEQICIGINQASELPEAYRADVSWKREQTMKSPTSSPQLKEI